ncbi:MAG: hypothetical protein N2044_03020 [Cyclobacteriaceae bacterium]|nr:hypothetical protein [Cyclobacteriaceae bacterium]MCX7636798.1 hypothetical protein [Cyclobacteriaceae bacterium]MDW8331311.1 hypothetical protein [Cyclobacteriaceae bacterium]
MDIFNTLKNYADQTGGSFSDYDHSKAIIVVPLPNGRFQTVLAVMEKSKTSGRQRIIFTSKVTDYNTSIDAHDLLVQNGLFDYSKFIVDDNQLKVVASGLTESISEDEVKFMVQEVAQLADHYELKLTGKDIH